MAEEKKVRIACRVVNGTMIHLWKTGPDDGTGFHPTIKDGAGVRLVGPSSLGAGAGSTELLDAEPGLTEVPKVWADKWFEQNAENPFVAQGLIYPLEEQEQPSRPEGEAA